MSLQLSTDGWRYVVSLNKPRQLLQGTHQNKLRDYVTNAWNIFMLFSTHSVAIPFMLNPKPVLPLGTWDILTDLKFRCGVLRSVTVWAFTQHSRGELSYLAPLGSENISAPYFKQCFFHGGDYPPDWVKHHASQSQDRNNKYFILYIEFCINNKI